MNNPFDEYMQNTDDLKTKLQDIVQNLADEFEKKLLFNVIREAGMDESVIHILELLLKNGCPISAITETFLDIAKEQEEPKNE